MDLIKDIRLFLGAWAWHWAPVKPNSPSSFSHDSPALRTSPRVSGMGASSGSARSPGASWSSPVWAANSENRWGSANQKTGLWHWPIWWWPIISRVKILPLYKFIFEVKNNRMGASFSDMRSVPCQRQMGARALIMAWLEVPDNDQIVKCLSSLRSPTTVLTISTVENIHCLKH